MKTKEQKILDSARKIAAISQTWADFSNKLFNPTDGLISEAFPTRAKREQFVRTTQYKAIRKLIDVAQERTGLVEGATPIELGFPTSTVQGEAILRHD